MKSFKQFLQESDAITTEPDPRSKMIALIANIEAAEYSNDQALAVSQLLDFIGQRWTSRLRYEIWVGPSSVRGGDDHGLDDATDPDQLDEHTNHQKRSRLLPFAEKISTRLKAVRKTQRVTHHRTGKTA